MPTYETYSTSLTHHGIKGQKWGVRRFQNVDGSYTNAGKKRYNIVDSTKTMIADKKAKNAAYKAKMKAIAENEDLDDRTRSQAKYASRSTVGKLANDAAVAVGTLGIQKLLTGDHSITKKDGEEIAFRILASSAGNHAYAKSMSKHYDEKGKRVDINYISGTVEATTASAAATSAAYIGAKVVGTMLGSAATARNNMD